MRLIVSLVVISIAIAAPSSASADEAGNGDNVGIQYRVRVVYLTPKSGPYGVSVASGTYPELSAEWGLAGDWSMELAIGTQAKYDAYSPETIRMTPVTLTGKYSFVDMAAVRAYLGAGVSETFLSLSHAGPTDSISSSQFSWVAQAGLDLAPTEHLVVNFDLRYLGSLEPTAAIVGRPGGKLKIDPTLFGVGLAYRFR